MKLFRLALIPHAVLLFTTRAGANRCDEMEREGHLIAQQLKRTKVCTES